MLSYTTYKVIHLFGILLMFVGLGGASIHAAAGGEKNPTSRKLIGALHGAGTLIALVAGFGLLARLQMSSAFAGWVVTKIAIWLLLAGLIAVPYRVRRLAAPMAILVPLLGMLAAWMAIAKPF